MRKLVKYVWAAALVLSMFLLGTVLADRHTLNTQLIRLRVVGASDEDGDQQVKLQVRDAVNAYLQENMPEDLNASGAEAFLTDHIPEITLVAEKTLKTLGDGNPVRVSLTREEATKRDYETFSLPSGVYKTLRVDIGAAQGSNWWCVVFPSLCVQPTVEAFHDSAVSGGMNEGLSSALSGKDGYEVRFFFLDCLGKLEKIFHKS